MNVSARLPAARRTRPGRLRAGVRLNIGEIAIEQLLRALDRQLFGNVHKFAAAVIPASRITLGIFVGENRALGFEHRAGDDVLRCDQLDLFCCRRRSSSMARAMSGSASARDAEKKPFPLAWAVPAMTDILRLS